MRRNNQSESRATMAQPVFSLVGTSRIGERRSAIVRHMGGDEISVRLDDGAATPIPDHEQYAIVEAGDGSLAIRYPASVPCQAFADQGVRCDGDSLARLSLTTAAALVEQPAAEDAAVEEGGDSAAESTPSDPRNPFELMRERARAGQDVTADAGANSQQFRPRRIDPADVPPGYRVVRTPFGDRLVEDD